MTWCSRLRRNSNSFSCGFCSPASAWLARPADSCCSTWRNFKTKKASRSSSKRRICSVDSSELLAGKGEKDGSASVFKKRWTASLPELSVIVFSYYLQGSKKACPCIYLSIQGLYPVEAKNQWRTGGDMVKKQASDVMVLQQRYRTQQI